MELYPAVIVHGRADAVAALAKAAAEGTPLTLLSAPGAALYAGCGWWRALIESARTEFPNVPCVDVLDCADATGHALAALRIGVARLVLWPDAPGRDAVVAIAESLGGFVLAAAPPGNAVLTISRENQDTIRSAGSQRDRGTGTGGTGIGDAGNAGPGNEDPGNRRPGDHGPGKQGSVSQGPGNRGPGDHDPENQGSKSWDHGER